jgi:hypothetical protein
MEKRYAPLLAAICLFIIAPPGRPQDTAGTEGVPTPKSEDEWHCPVEAGASIIQGNNGTLSHNDDHNRYAFDYYVRVGTPLVASRSGVVESSRMLSNIGGPDHAFRQDANAIVIRHSDGTSALYAHLAKNRNLVRVGEFVLQGERIGYSGDTGFSTGPHLHFNGGKLSFADFTKKDGVPDKGDTHGPPTKPAVPQAVVESYKTIHRACLYAERIGMPEIAMHLLLGLPAGTRYPEYFYTKVMEKKRERYVLEMEKRADVTKGDPLVLALLKKVAARTPSLKALSDRISVPEGGPGSTEVNKLLDACRLEAMGNAPQAGVAYASLTTSSSPLVKEAAKAGIKRLIANYHNDYEAEMERLVYESGRCLAKHEPVVKKDLDELAAKLMGLVKAWKQHFPEEADKAERVIRNAEAQYMSATKSLQERK